MNCGAESRWVQQRQRRSQCSKSVGSCARLQRPQFSLVISGWAPSLRSTSRRWHRGNLPQIQTISISVPAIPVRFERGSNPVQAWTSPSQMGALFNSSAPHCSGTILALYASPIGSPVRKGNFWWCAARPARRNILRCSIPITGPSTYSRGSQPIGLTQSPRRASASILRAWYATRNRLLSWPCDHGPGSRSP